MPRRPPPPKKIRLGTGAHTHQDEQVLRGRVEYLAAIRRLRPHVLCELRDMVLPTITAGAVEEAVGAAFSAWAARWSLTDPWVRHAANRTLVAWSLAPTLLETDSPPKWQWAGEAFMVVPRPEPPPIVVDGWRAETETQAAFDARWRRARDAHVKAAQARVAWPATRRVSIEIIEWLVRRVVPTTAGHVEGPSEIAARLDIRVENDAIRKAITRAATYLGVAVPSIREADD